MQPAVDLVVNVNKKFEIGTVGCGRPAASLAA
jgi:hypothetical protein